jgi:hypothetical protein
VEGGGKAWRQERVIFFSWSADIRRYCVTKRAIFWSVSASQSGAEPDPKFNFKNGQYQSLTSRHNEPEYIEAAFSLRRMAILEKTLQVTIPVIIELAEVTSPITIYGK